MSFKAIRVHSDITGRYSWSALEAHIVPISLRWPHLGIFDLQKPGYRICLDLILCFKAIKGCTDISFCDFFMCAKSEMCLPISVGLQNV